MEKILRIDLATGKVKKEPIPETWKRKYIGTYGIGGKILYDEVPPWVDAFDPLNKLIFATGPVTATGVQTSGRFTVIFKSPLTGYFGDTSCGGFWGSELKFAGYDIIVLNGRAHKPTMVSIKDDEVKLLDAASYWDMNVRESDRAIKSDLGDKKTQVTNIGAAGKNLVRYAAVGHDEAGRFGGRGGGGAVMGHKNLHSIAVRGSNKVDVHDPPALRELTKQVIKDYKTPGGAMEPWSKGGTPNFFSIAWESGSAPSYNWADDVYGKYDADKISWPGEFDQILKKTDTCHICAIGCRRVSHGGRGKTDAKYEIEDGVEGVEYENMTMLGSNCGIHDLWAINKINDLCNLYGLDTISTGGTISFAMECFENGLLTKDDTDGLDLRFGNADAEIELIHKIANREGKIGNLLAEGSRRAAAIIGNGAEKYAIQIKGMELAAHDPRSFQGGTGHYATTTSGGRHTEGLSEALERFGGANPDLGLNDKYDGFSSLNKGGIVKATEDWTSVNHVMGWCMFAHDFGGYLGSEEHFMKVFNSVTGMNMDLKEAMLIGERVINLRKAFNMRHGCTREEDTLPERLQKLPNKRAENQVCNLEEVLPQVYEARGWDPSTSIPTKDKLKELGLVELIDDLYG